tara:strand:+ start:14097 stop:15326 length:1230 start_codon:yes stop_codon:yes gene_type:complete
MKILFIHQNFPGQFKFLAPALIKKGHSVSALCLDENKKQFSREINVIYYQIDKGSTKNIHPYVSDFEAKVIRGEACYLKAIEIKKNGFSPDVIISHHGWGESMFLHHVWPKAKIGLYCEFFYKVSGADVGFDLEFEPEILSDYNRIQLKNVNNYVHFENADKGISPTLWQASTFPTFFRKNITVIHDGIDTRNLRPNNEASLILNKTIHIKSSDEIITFINRNLEPYRGYHIFMRSLPKILKERPNVKILIVGGDEVSYGREAPKGNSWKNIFFNEIKSQLSESERKRIFYLGYIPYEHYVSLLQISSVHIYLTYPFVLSWSLLEAMSIGCSIIASDTKPLHEVITDEENGLLFDFFDYNKLANLVIRLLDNSSLRKKIGNNAREFAIKNYDINLCLNKQIDWVESFIK